MQIVLISGHGDDLRDDGLLGPVRAKLLHQLLQVVGGGLADGVDVIDEPSHAEAVQLLVEELHSELSWKLKNRFVLHNIIFLKRPQQKNT